ncbi:translation initiation factor IF-2-like isoform X2 [Patiria miniata]|uniref:Uncharacterized protein n=1 Tax=Patiria miniata TaxID=46514 RepID=A0A913Z9X4_PATMI|nr:translation initiation factor IF-2-like isoform X2 [Patiria miniata]
MEKYASGQQPSTDETDASPVRDAPGAPSGDIGAGGPATQASADASSGAGPGGRPSAPQATAARSAGGPMIGEMLITGEQCPLIGHAEDTEFEFHSVKATGGQAGPRPNEAGRQETESMKQTNPPDVVHTCIQGSSSVYSGGAGVGSGPVDGSGPRIGKLTISGSNNPVILDARRTKFTFTSTSHKK